jgi:hypothetical protein
MYIYISTYQQNMYEKGYAQLVAECNGYVTCWIHSEAVEALCSLHETISQGLCSCTFLNTLLQQYNTSTFASSLYLSLFEPTKQHIHTCLYIDINNVNTHTTHTFCIYIMYISYHIYHIRWSLVI